jgi:hypothetical protein
MTVGDNSTHSPKRESRIGNTGPGKKKSDSRVFKPGIGNRNETNNKPIIRMCIYQPTSLRIDVIGHWTINA